MSGFAWCRFCGGIGQADRMVCASSECMARDLAEQLQPGMIDWGPFQDMARTTSLVPGGSPNTRIVVGSVPSPHTQHVHIGFDAAISITPGMRNQWQTWRLSNS